MIKAALLFKTKQLLEPEEGSGDGNMIDGEDVHKVFVDCFREGVMSV